MVEEVKKTKEQSKKKTKRPSAQTRLFAVIRLRGQVNVSNVHEKTMKLLRLHKKNRCILIPTTPAYIGMLNKIRDYCTFGELDKETLNELIQKRGRLKGDKQLTEEFITKNYNLSFKDFLEELYSLKKTLKDFDAIKPFFKLHPPRGGFERYGIKKPYSTGGALGYRGAEINKLLRKMI